MMNCNPRTYRHLCFPVLRSHIGNMETRSKRKLSTIGGNTLKKTYTFLNFKHPPSHLIFSRKLRLSELMLALPAFQLEG